MTTRFAVGMIAAPHCRTETSSTSFKEDCPAAVPPTPRSNERKVNTAQKRKFATPSSNITVRVHHAIGPAGAIAHQMSRRALLHHHGLLTPRRGTRFPHHDLDGAGSAHAKRSNIIAREAFHPPAFQSNTNWSCIAETSCSWRPTRHCRPKLNNTDVRPPPRPPHVKSLVKA